jgi:uncharacterized peroxidase-related enzyme
MAHITVPDGVPGIRSLLASRPEVAGPMAALADALLHAPNTLPAGERELIGAYVSALNGCDFCRASHQAVAACHLGVDAGVVAASIRHPETAGIAPKLKALLHLAARVQQGGRSVTAADVARARECGATDREIHDVVLIAAMFCMFNRYVDGLDAWTPDDPGTYRERAQSVAQHGYAGSMRHDPSPEARRP